MLKPYSLLRLLAAALAALCWMPAAAAPAGPAPQTPKLLLVSQPEDAADSKNFADIAPVLQIAIEGTGKYTVLTFQPDLPAVQEALGSGKLTAADLTTPLSMSAIHKIAGALGASDAMRVSARNERDGLTVDAALDHRSGQNIWSTVYTSRLEPYRGSGKKPGFGEQVHARVATLVEAITGAKPVEPAKTTAPPAPSAGSQDGARPPAPQPVGPAPAPALSSNATAPSIPAALPDYSADIERARRNGDTANLILYLRRAINDKPRDVSLRRDLVRAYAGRGWQDMARDEAQRAVALAPSDPALHRLLADALLDSGDGLEALNEYQQAIKLNPKDASNLVALGDAYWNAGKPDEAQKAFEDAAKADPKAADPHRRLANLYVQRGRFTECAAEMKAAKDLTPASDTASFNADAASMLTAIGNMQTDVLGKMQVARKGFFDGTHTRETAFSDFSGLKKQAEQIAAFLEALPATPYSRVQALYTQSALLITQSTEASLQHLESQNSADDEQASLLRVEASKQLAEANRQMKELTAPQPAK